MPFPSARLAGLVLASLIWSVSIAQSVDTEGSSPPLAATDQAEEPAASSDEIPTRLGHPPPPPDRCHSSERNPEQGPIFNPACNAYMTARPRGASGPTAKLGIAPLAVEPSSGARHPSAAPALASARALARSPIAIPHDARFSEGYLAMPASYRALEDRLRIDASAQLLRPQPDRVRLAVGAAAELWASPILKLRAQTHARPAPDGFALTYGAGAEIEPIPALRLRAQTEFDEQTSRYGIGARCQIVPKRVDLELSGNRQPGIDPDTWVWRTQLTFRAPFLD